MTNEQLIEKLQALGLTLPEPAKPIGSYVPGLLDPEAKQLLVSGQLPLRSGKLLAEGKLGAEIDEQTGVLGAQQCVLNALAIALSLLDGDVSRINQVLFVRGYVASTPDYYNHPKVLNGASDLLVSIFGEKGKHSRAVLGVSALPLNAPIEIEILFSYI